jgi:hypothetical protein
LIFAQHKLCRSFAAEAESVNDDLKIVDADMDDVIQEEAAVAMVDSNDVDIDEFPNVAANIQVKISENIVFLFSQINRLLLGQFHTKAPLYY